MTVLTLDAAERLVEQTLAAIPRCMAQCGGSCRKAADRERLASDLAGLRLAYKWYDEGRIHISVLAILRATAHENIRRTVRLYGIEP